LGLFAVNGSGQVLAKGSPPLTETIVSRMQTVFEFTLNQRFDSAESKRFRQILVGYWQRDSRNDINSCLEYVKVADMLDQLADNQKDAARQKLLAAIEQAVRSNPNDALAQLLAEVYNQSQANGNLNPTTDGQQNPIVSNGGGSVPSALLGTWILRKGSGSGYVNPTNGTTSGPNATVHSYTFYANGTFEYALLMQSSLYQCTTAINGYEAGAFEADASTISFYTKKATKSFQDNCRPNLNSKGPAEVRAPMKLYYRIARDEYNNLNLCVAGGNGKETCFVKQ
jgi:hypothetical protein